MARLSLSSTDSLEPCFLPIKATRYNAHQFTATSTRVRSTCCKCHEDSLECAAEHFTVKSLILHSCFFLIKSVHFPVVVLCQRKKKNLKRRATVLLRVKGTYRRAWVWRFPLQYDGFITILKQYLVPGFVTEMLNNVATRLIFLDVLPDNAVSTTEV